MVELQRRGRIFAGIQLRRLGFLINVSTERLLAIQKPQLTK